MGFQLSPGVNVSEIDLTNIVPAVDTSGGGFVGQFHWGPVMDYTIVEDEGRLEFLFGKPSDVNYTDWFSAANFSAYSSNLNVIRVVDESDAKNSTADGLGVLIKNRQHYELVAPTAASAIFAAKYPGELGNSIEIHVADADTFDAWAYKDEFDGAPATSNWCIDKGAPNAKDELHVIVIDKNGLFTGVPGAILERFGFVSKAKDNKTLDGEPNFYGNIVNKQSSFVWYLGAPASSSYLTDGAITSATITAGGTGYTSATVAITGDGTGATADVVLTGDAVTGITITNPGSGYTSATITITGDGTGATADAVIVDAGTTDWATNVVPNVEFKTLATAQTYSLTAGDDGSLVTSNELIEGWSMFENAEVVDVSLLFTGDAGGQSVSGDVVRHVIDNVCETRKDVIVFFSPDKADVFNQTREQATENVIAFRNTKINRPSSYAIMDSGWKYQYDKYNDTYRWVPLNADIAGLAARTDDIADPWYSPAGYSRGQIKNVVQLALNPSKQNRDNLYKNGVNPVVSFAGEGTLLYGDRTQQLRSAAFSKINIRRLFIVLEKAIAIAAKYQLFEFNDDFTRSQFRNMVEPFLQEVKARRGIYEFKVVCDNTNNTPEVIDRSEFVADIYIKPAYSINFIQLNFVAVRTGVEFDEVIGA